MDQHDLTQPRTLHKSERKPSVSCTQCGETLDAAFVQRVAMRTDKILCRDCAFDQIACTD